MMPMTFAQSGEEYIIKKLSCGVGEKSKLEKIGLCVGAAVTVIAVSGDNYIVRIKQARVALNAETAGKIMV